MEYALKVNQLIKVKLLIKQPAIIELNTLIWIYLNT